MKKTLFAVLCAFFAGSNVFSGIWDKVNIPPLYQATSDGNVDEVQHLLESGADPNNSSFLETSPLQYAASNCGYEYECIVHLLIQYGARIDQGDSEGQTALHYVVNNNVAMLGLLLSLGANPNALDTNKNTPLHGVIDRHHPTYHDTLPMVVYMLSCSDANPTYKNKFDETPLTIIEERKESNPNLYDDDMKAVLADEWKYLDIKQKARILSRCKPAIQALRNPADCPLAHDGSLSMLIGLLRDCDTEVKHNLYESELPSAWWFMPAFAASATGHTQASTKIDLHEENFAGLRVLTSIPGMGHGPEYQRPQNPSLQQCLYDPVCENAVYTQYKEKKQSAATRLQAALRTIIAQRATQAKK